MYSEIFMIFGLVGMGIFSAEKERYETAFVFFILVVWKALIIAGVI
jgi:hypothetical protein